MHQCSAQTYSSPPLPTLLGASCISQDRLIKFSPSAMQLQHSQGSCQVACSQPLRQGLTPSSLSPRGTVPEGCRALGVHSRTPDALAMLAQAPFQGTTPSDLTPHVTVSGGFQTPRGTGSGGYPTPQTLAVPAQTLWQGRAPSSGFGIEDLHVGIGGCDPTQEPLRSQILAKLGVPKQARVERLGGHCGGLNGGIWVVQDPSSRSSLVLKLVRSRCAYGAPSEAEKFARMFREHPTIENDPAVSFPVKVFKCVGHAGSNSYDVVVMQKATGQPLGDVLALKHSMGQMQDIKEILRQFGSFLARFHKSYGNKQHGDLQPSNIFYDASSGAFALIDIADLGHNSVESDVSHFSQSLRILSNCFGQDFYSDGKRSFEEGYRGLR